MTWRCSVSQVRTAEDCLRKWGFDKIDRVPRAPSASADLGSAVHKQLELYLRDGIPLDLTTEPGQIAMSGIHLLPPAPYVVEHRVDVELDGIPFVGFIDILSPGTVHDHKTSGDLRFALTADELQGDTQGTFYTFATRSDESHWIYYRTKGARKAVDVRAKVDRMRQDDRLAATVATARTLRSLILAPPQGAIELPPNPDACDRYGGCPHKLSGRCAGEFSDTERMRSFMSTASMLDQLAQRVNPPAAPAPTAAAAPAVEDLPPLLANGTRDLPEGAGLFWYRGPSGWSAAPEAMRAQLDPDGTKSWPRPVAALGAPLEGVRVLATQAEAEQAMGAAPGALAGLIDPPPENLVIGSRSPLASVLESAEKAEREAPPTLGGCSTANTPTDIDALLAGSPPAKAKRGGRKAKETPDLDPRVKVLHDPDAEPSAPDPSGPPTEAEDLRAELIEEGAARGVGIYEGRYDPLGMRSGRTSSAGSDPGADLRAAILGRAFELCKNASADELSTLAFMLERVGS